MNCIIKLNAYALKSAKKSLRRAYSVLEGCDEATYCQLLNEIASPHPNPLPRGEGALFPSPLGRGIKGEGKLQVKIATFYL